IYSHGNINLNGNQFLELVKQTKLEKSCTTLFKRTKPSFHVLGIHQHASPCIICSGKIL
ncbi:unnamed protein product, partial [Musa acuminata subsp. burmannicoides]